MFPIDLGSYKYLKYPFSVESMYVRKYIRGKKGSNVSNIKTNTQWFVFDLFYEHKERK